MPIVLPRRREHRDPPVVQFLAANTAGRCLRHYGPLNGTTLVGAFGAGIKISATGKKHNVAFVDLTCRRAPTVTTPLSAVTTREAVALWIPLWVTPAKRAGVSSAAGPCQLGPHA